MTSESNSITVKKSSVMLMARCNLAIDDNSTDSLLSQQLARGLSAKGVAVDFAGVFSASPELPLAQHYMVAKSKVTPSMYGFAFLWRGQRFALRAPKLVHTQELTLSFGVPLLMPAVPLVATINAELPLDGAPHQLFQRALHRFHQWMLNKCSGLVFTSEKLRNYHLSHFAEETKGTATAVIEMQAGEDDDRGFGSSRVLRDRLATSKKVLLAVVGSEVTADLEVLLEAWGLLSSVRDDCILLLVSEGKVSPQVQQACKGLESSLKVVPFSEFRASEGELMRSALGYVQYAEPSEDLRGAFNWMELAFGCGTPVVVREDFPQAERLVQGEMGYRIPHEVEMYRDALGALLEVMIDRDSVRSFHERTAMQHYPSAPDPTGEYLEFFTKVMSGN